MNRALRRIDPLWQARNGAHPRYRRAFCRVFGHWRVHVFDKVAVTQDSFGVTGRVTASHHECGRCKTPMPRVDARRPVGPA